MKKKCYVDAEADRYTSTHFKHCLKDVCHVFGIPLLRKTGRVEGNGFYHMSEFLLPDNVNEEDFDELLNDSLTNDESEYDESEY
jgi:hypothetical protein